jgi:DUF917 family protein
MSYLITPEHLPDLARGAALLGTGGGGDPFIGRLMVEQAMAISGRPIQVLEVNDLDDDAVVIPTAMMGAPTVMLEKIPRGTAAELSLRALEGHLGVAATATMPVECGGINSMIPLTVAAASGLPVVDADGMGRAFPELHMETFSVYGVPASPMTVAGDGDEVTIIDTGTDNARAEWLARGLTIRLGGASCISLYKMSGADVRRTAIPGTLGLCLELGKTLREAREEHRPSLEALAEALGRSQYMHLRRLCDGKVVDVERRTDRGFTVGRSAIQPFDGGDPVELTFQNEHLVARAGERLLCIVPDLICVLDMETGEPITTETLRFGQRVSVIGISTPPIMRTPEALAVFGPGSFGLQESFTPVEQLNPEAVQV